MTIGGLVTVLIVAVVFVISCSGIGLSLTNSWKGLVAGLLVGLMISALFGGGMYWYFQNTASGQRALVDQRSELNNGLERTITVYTANGEVIAQYAGKIDIEDNDGGYVIFDYNGKRYTYYNCFIESIADIN